MKKKKITLILYLLFASLSISGVSFGAYIVDDNNQINVEVATIPNKITVINKDFSFLTYKGISQHLTTYENDILESTFSLSFNFDQYTFINNNPYAYGGLEILINFGNNNLYTYLKNDVKNEFVQFRFNDYKLIPSSLDYTNGKLCVDYSAENEMISRIPFLREYNNNFYLQKIVQDNSSEIAQTAGNWNFNIDFCFNLVDENLGYSTEFNLQNLGAINISLFSVRYNV